MNSEFRNFAIKLEFTHSTFSPGFPRSNGQAERTVQTVNKLLKKAQESDGDPYFTLLYRNTPLDGIGYSPAQLLMGRRLKSELPASTMLLKPESNINVQDKLQMRQFKQKHYYDRHARNLPVLQRGEKVRIKQDNKWEPAVVLDRHD